MLNIFPLLLQLGGRVAPPEKEGANFTPGHTEHANAVHLEMD